MTGLKPPRIPESLSLPALGGCGFTLGLQPVACRWLKGKEGNDLAVCQPPQPSLSQFGVLNSWQLRKGFPSEEYNAVKLWPVTRFHRVGKHLWFGKRKENPVLSTGKRWCRGRLRKE